MNVSIIWFVTDRGTEEQVVSRLSENAERFQEWPHVSLNSIGQLELMELYRVLNPGVAEPPNISGEMLVKQADEGLYVTKLNEGFLKALSWVDESNISEVAARWAQSVGTERSEAMNLMSNLSLLSSFARHANIAEKVILQAITI